MRLALELARGGLGSVSPNPLVGAVLVRRGRILGQGFHRRFGGPHAEVEAFRDALKRGESAKGADLHVTLEPCGHHGKTPPCALAILEAGVARVFYGARDPNPLTRGVGPRMLRSAGVMVTEGALRRECVHLNAPFFHWIETRTPWVIVKWAMTLDGRTAGPGGESKWITGNAARERAHDLRRRVDAVLVGTETALLDDPLLTPRPARGRKPLRILLDRRCRLPSRLQLLRREPRIASPRLCVTSTRAPEARLKALRARGVETLAVPEDENGLDLGALLVELGARGISQLLVEGGASLHGSFLRQGLAHEVAVFIAPRLLGSKGSRPAVEGSGIARLIETPWLEDPSVERLGVDVLIHGRLRPKRGRRPSGARAAATTTRGPSVSRYALAPGQPSPATAVPLSRETCGPRIGQRNRL